MARRWYVPLLALPVVIGTVVAVAAGVASASPGLAHPAAQGAAAQRIFPGTPMIRPSGGATPSMGSELNATELSLNWAGYVLEGREGFFRSVSSRWIQPAAHCRGVVGHRYAAFWVGLDGATDHSVEQTGADSDCVGTTPRYYGWYEMYPALPVFFRTRIRAGDHMSASVTFRGPTTYVLVLRDSTRGWVHIITKREAGLGRSSAEVITEAPSTTTGAVLPLANFGKIVLAGSRVNGTLLQRLGRRIRLVMVDRFGRVKCQTSLVNIFDRFTNTYVRAT